MKSGSLVKTPLVVTARRSQALLLTPPVAADNSFRPCRHHRYRANSIPAAL